MAYAPSIATKTNVYDLAQRRRPNRKGLLTLILETLHQTRRLQAQRTLRQYRHLINEAVADKLQAIEADCGEHHVEK